MGFYLLDVSTFRGLERLGLGILGSRISGFKILNSGFLDASGFMFLASGLSGFWVQGSWAELLDVSV